VTMYPRGTALKGWHVQSCTQQGAFVCMLECPAAAEATRAALAVLSAPVPECGCEQVGVQFCNYDYGDSGFCEACDDVPGGYITGCHRWGLPAAGAADCRKWCFETVAQPPSPPRMQTAIVRLDASDPNGFVGNDAVNLVTGARWTAQNRSCAMSSHRGVPVFDMEDPRCYFETEEQYAYCGASGGYTTATWLDWRDASAQARTLHHSSGGAISTVRGGTLALGCSAASFRDSGFDIVASGWTMLLAVAVDDDCAPDGGWGGHTNYYHATPSNAPTLVGTCDRAPAAGEFTWQLGMAGEGPGKVAETWAWDAPLSAVEVQTFWANTAYRYVGSS